MRYQFDDKIILIFILDVILNLVEFTSIDGINIGS
jgi:hypothetical protein